MIGQRNSKLNDMETAIAGSRDSNDMRIIATVTLIFLPGIFTATLFSTTFFVFQSRTSSIVSWWIWLYFVVTVGLALVVLGGWYYTSQKQNRTMLQSLGFISSRRAAVKDEEGFVPSREAPVKVDKETIMQFILVPFPFGASQTWGFTSSVNWVAGIFGDRVSASSQGTST